jgi:hypothetical protein
MADFADKTEQAQREVREAGIGNWTARPPFYRLYKLVGLRIRPPHYNSFILNFAFFGISFWILYFLLIMLVGIDFDGGNIRGAAILSTVLSLCASVYLANAYREDRKRFKLSKWEDLN